MNEIKFRCYLTVPTSIAIFLGITCITFSISCVRSTDFQETVIRQSQDHRIDTGSIYKSASHEGGKILSNGECASIFLEQYSYHVCWDEGKKISERLLHDSGVVFSNAWDTNGVVKFAAPPETIQ